MLAAVPAQPQNQDIEPRYLGHGEEISSLGVQSSNAGRREATTPGTNHPRHGRWTRFETDGVEEAMQTGIGFTARSKLVAALILVVGPYLDSPDISALTRTNKEMYAILQPVLYSRAVAMIRPAIPTTFQHSPTPNRSLLHFAAAHGNMRLLKSVIYGLNGSADLVNTADKHGHTPLLSAVLWGNLAAVELLLDSGADIEATTTSCGWSSLHCAALYGNVEMARFLADSGAQTTRKDRIAGFTPLHLASLSVGLFSSFHDLLPLGWDPNVKDDFGIDAQDSSWFPWRWQDTFMQRDFGTDDPRSAATPGRYFESLGLTGSQLRQRNLRCREVYDASYDIFLNEADRCGWCDGGRNLSKLTDTARSKLQLALAPLHRRKR